LTGGSPDAASQVAGGGADLVGIATPVRARRSGTHALSLGVAVLVGPALHAEAAARAARVIRRGNALPAGAAPRARRSSAATGSIRAGLTVCAFRAFVSSRAGVRVLASERDARFALATATGARSRRARAYAGRSARLARCARTALKAPAPANVFVLAGVRDASSTRIAAAPWTGRGVAYALAGGVACLPIRALGAGVARASTSIFGRRQARAGARAATGRARGAAAARALAAFLTLCARDAGSACGSARVIRRRNARVVGAATTGGTSRRAASADDVGASVRIHARRVRRGVAATRIGSVKPGRIGNIHGNVGASPVGAVARQIDSHVGRDITGQ
jgi:hypothetical protein